MCANTPLAVLILSSLVPYLISSIAFLYAFATMLPKYGTSSICYLLQLFVLSCVDSHFVSLFKFYSLGIELIENPFHLINV